MQFAGRGTKARVPTESLAARRACQVIRDFHYTIRYHKFLLEMNERPKMTLLNFSDTIYLGFNHVS